MGWAHLAEKIEIELPTPEEGDDRHMKMLEAIAPYARKVNPSNITPVEIVPTSKKTSIALILLPEWSPMFAPFNIARLSSLALAAGYSTKCYDINVKLYNLHRQWVKEGKLDYNPWDGARAYKWSDKKEYFKDLHPLFEPILQEYVDDILQYNPTVVGFTMYYTNEHSVMWMAKQIKDRRPDIKLIVGGPGLHVRQTDLLDNPEYRYNGKHLFDYSVVGEAEKIILDILDEIENGVQHDDLQALTQPEKQRLDLNNFPIPDYKDFDHSEYEIPNGLLTEFSRGCVAKCTFCEETHFWNYRQRTAVSAIDEIEHLYYNKGANVVWFLDSLVNGNIKELRGFAKGVIAKKIFLKWTGYARCDGRMDDDYFKDLAKSGCFMLNYGCESGSDKVLKDIDKRVVKTEMEANFASAAKYGIMNMTNWIVGFPTEQYGDFADTMTLLWRNKNNYITVIATAPGFGLGVQTIVGQNPEGFGLESIFFMGSVMRKDFTLTKVHTLMRVKFFAIFAKLFRDNVDYEVAIPERPNMVGKHYTIEFDEPGVTYFTPFEEEVDYNIVNIDDKLSYKTYGKDTVAFANSIMNEPFVLFRMMWRMFGGFSMNLKFGYDLDQEEFGDGLACPFTANVNFKIDKEGNWSSRAYYTFVHPQPFFDNMNPFPFKAFDFTNWNSAAAKRARKLSKRPEGEATVSPEKMGALMDTAKEYNTSVDLTFDHFWEGSGKWECVREEFPVIEKVEVDLDSEEDIEEVVEEIVEEIQQPIPVPEELEKTIKSETDNSFKSILKPKEKEQEVPQKNLI